MGIVNIITLFYNFVKGVIGKYMISYEPLWKTLKSKEISTYCLIKSYNMSTGTLHRLKKGKHITTQTLDDICRMLDCGVDEVIVYIKDK